MVLGFFVGSMVLVPLLISWSSERRLQVPSEPLTTVSFFASPSPTLLPLTSRATTLQVPSYCFRSFLIAPSLVSPAVATAPSAVTKVPPTRNPKKARFMMDLQEQGNAGLRVSARCPF